MKRYQYRPVEQTHPPSRTWLIPVGLAGLAIGLVAVASIGASRDSGIQSDKARPEGSQSAHSRAGSDLEETILVSEVPRQTFQHEFKHCGVIRRTCVVDGDTFWLEGEKIRIADIDTPEVSKPQCASEKALGDQATNRLVQLLNAGPFELSPIGNRDEDQYGRKLRVVTRDGRSLGDQLVSEGLARTWTGRREPWC